MSLMGDAFENTISLNTSEVSYFSKPYDIGRSIVEEPPYLEATTKSSIEASEQFKRVDGLRVSLNESHLKSPRENSGGSGAAVPFLARIIGNRSTDDTAETPTSWYYAWESVVPDVDGSYTVGSYPGIRTSTSGDEFEARNTMEADNSEDCVGPGVCMLQVECEYPTGWKIQPIGGETCLVQPVVIMYQLSIGPVSPTYVFQAENAHDGTCPLEVEEP